MWDKEDGEGKRKWRQERQSGSRQTTRNKVGSRREGLSAHRHHLNFLIAEFSRLLIVASLCLSLSHSLSLSFFVCVCAFLTCPAVSSISSPTHSLSTSTSMRYASSGYVDKESSDASINVRINNSVTEKGNWKAKKSQSKQITGDSKGVFHKSLCRTEG